MNKTNSNTKNAALNNAKCCDDCWHEPQKPCHDFVDCLTQGPECHDNLECNDAVNKNIAFQRYESITRPVIFLGAGTCGLGAGAAKTRDALVKYLSDNKLDAEIVEVGCIGLCALEPIVDIQLPGRTRVSFKKVTENKVNDLLNAFFGGEVPENMVIGQHRNSKLNPFEKVQYIEDIPFFKLQKRWVLANCGIIAPTNIDQYIARDGYKALARALKNHTQADLCDIIELSGLRGRGGGGFPTGKKWKFALNNEQKERYLICNADEGDPGAFMDRAVIEGDPYRLLEGIAIAAYSIGAQKAYIYIRAEYPLAIEHLKTSIEKCKEYGFIGNNILDSGFNLEVVIKKGAGAFVCGEETALINSIEGRRGMPRPRPPYPANKGLFGKPTVINNVETLANVPGIVFNGAEWFNSVGTKQSKGTKVFALSGHIKYTGLVEVAMGTPIRKIIYEIGGGIPDGRKFKAVQIGGPSGGCIPESHLDVDVDYESLKTVGAMMGSGGLVVMNEDTCKSPTPIWPCCCGITAWTPRLAADLTKQIDGFKTGNARPPALSQNIVDLTREAWLLGTVNFGEQAVRSGHLLCALLSADALMRVTSAASGEFEKISPEALRKELPTLVASTDEASQAPAKTAAAGPALAGKPGGPTKTPALDQFTIDLTARARRGDIDPVLGRDPEVRQIIDILTRRRQNNPILTGEAGVGKTAVVEGFALRVAAGDVPPALRNVAIRTLDLGLLQAGAGVRGEFENRLKTVIEEVKASPAPIILFIDEAHTMIGAGGQAGGGDAANLLKPALARGELRTIAATTWAEYKKYFEKDAALARRFQVVKVEEPTERSACEMLRGLVGTLENHHQVRILEEGLTEAVRLSNRYISGRQLPDKAVSVLDTTCARIAISQSATPPLIEDCRRRIQQLGVWIDILTRESATGRNHQVELTDLTTRQQAATAELEQLQARWEQEKDWVAKIRQWRDQLEQGLSTTSDSASQKPAAPPAAPPPPPLAPEERARIQGELEAAELQLKQLQGESPLVHVCVDAQAVAETVAGWTGIPLGRMVADEVRTVLNLKELMERYIVGQSHALDVIAQSIRTSRANLADPRRPIGVFLLAGTSGVGKTETAITLANLLYGGEQNMTVINMSEFKEEHKVSLLMGSPPGYVGYGEGGVLTEAVRRKPYSVVLLDEMEKAHPGVQDIFYQVFDKGAMKDGEGRDIDFKNTVILMTTNAGTEVIKSLCSDPDTAPEPEEFTSALFPELLKTFKPAFLGRLSVVPFYPLSDSVMRMIIELKLGKIARRVAENYKAKFSYTPELVERIAARCTEVDTGARNVDHILTKTLLPEMSAEFLARMADGRSISAVEITVSEGGAFQYRIS